MYQVLELISQIIYFFNRFFFISIGTLMAVIELVCIQVEVVEAGVMGSALFRCLLLFWYFYQELKIQIQEKPRKPHSPHPPNYCGYHKEDEDWRYLLMVVYCMRISRSFKNWPDRWIQVSRNVAQHFLTFILLFLLSSQLLYPFWFLISAMSVHPHIETLVIFAFLQKHSFSM